jgi:hypothetical protein
MGNLVTSHNSSAHGVLIFDQVQANGYPRLNNNGIAIMACRCILSSSERRNMAFQRQPNVINELGLGTLHAYISEWDDQLLCIIYLSI